MSISGRSQPSAHLAMGLASAGGEFRPFAVCEFSTNVVVSTVLCYSQPKAYRNVCRRLKARDAKLASL